MTSQWYSERELWVRLVPPIVTLSEAKDQREILRFTQDDKAVLPVALWPTRAHARLRLMPIGADKSALGTVNRPLHCLDARLPTTNSYTLVRTLCCFNMHKRDTLTLCASGLNGKIS